MQRASSQDLIVAAKRPLPVYKREFWLIISSIPINSVLVLAIRSMRKRTQT
jgi:hypothetical protein